MTTCTDWEWDEFPMARLEVMFDEYMGSLYNSILDTPEEMPETETGFDFCGCDTCVTRETFAFLMPRFLDMYLSGSIQLTKQHDDKDGDSDGLRDMQEGG